MLAKIEPGMRIGIFIGPEGGFEQSEVEQAGLRQALFRSRLETESLEQRRPH